MVLPTRVEVDGRDDDVHRGDDRSRWIWLAAGAVGGFLAAFLLFGAEPLELGAPAAVQADDLVSEDPEPGIGDAIPGFKDGLVAVTSSDGETMDLTIWPVAGPSYDRDVPLGTALTRDDVRFDASGRRIAAMQFVPGEAFSGLVAGVPESVKLVDIGVTGYSWSDSVPGSLAFTTIEDAVMNLWTMDIASSEPALVGVLERLDGGLVAWGEWGFAIQDAGREEVTVLSPSAVVRRIDSGRLLGSHHNGSLVIYDGEVKVHRVVAGVRGFDERFRVVGDPLTAEISPDGRKLAVLGNEGLLVLPLEGDAAVVQADPRNGVGQIAWSSDNRFILLPGIRGLTVVDIRGSRLDYVLGDRTFLGVSVLPASS